MAERFADAALRHLETAGVLEEEGRVDDSAYHYGLVGEMALKAALEKVLPKPLPQHLRRHINQQPKSPPHNRQPKSLQQQIAGDVSIMQMMRNGRLGGALGVELSQGFLDHRFVDWSLDIRYADDDHCPVKMTNLAVWKVDAIALYNSGVF
ncbi:MAG: hypothetical protein WCC64_04775 [Aliidongia sp.]